MPKHVRFSPSVAFPVPSSPHDDAAFAMLDLHRSGSRVPACPFSFTGAKRKFCDAPSTWTSRLVSPHDDPPQSRNAAKTFTRVSGIPAPPFLDDDDVDRSSAMSREAKRAAKTKDPLDLLSTVSSQLGPESSRQELYCCPISSEDGASTLDGDSHDPHCPTLQQGCQTYPNGSTYLGNFLGTQRHGFGICHYPNGHTYTGLWSNGQRNGLGEMQYANGQSYEGQWRNDRQEGRGVFHYSDGSADVAFWSGLQSVFGVRWSPDRQLMWRLVDGMKGEMVGRKTALEIGRDVGVKGIPERC